MDLLNLSSKVIYLDFWSKTYYLIVKAPKQKKKNKKKLSDNEIDSTGKS